MHYATKVRIPAETFTNNQHRECTNLLILLDNTWKESSNSGNARP